ncbi:MAG TPA: hypothetical protein VJ715_08530 [Pyrinomonadaceae bacterium]|nr:hypothetical protein [Pyrinomonadaceae bacterium]
MQSLSLHESAAQNAQPDLELQVSRLELLLAERRAELAALQQELRAFKEQYAQIVGGRLAELGEVERSIKEAEARLFDLEMETDAEENVASDDAAPSSVATGKSAMRKLFWSVARLFHPDHAADEREASRRHAVMAEASRAYQAGDVESLHTLLGDEQLHFFCTTQGAADEGEEDLASQFLRLKGELNTIEFGLKRIRQDGLYRLKLKVDEDASAGRDALAQMAENIDRQITKARRRLEHLGG